MRFMICSLLVTVAVLAALAQVPASRETDTSGWTDLLADKSLKGWTRLPIPPTAPLSEVSPWNFDAGAGTLVCEGNKAGHEWLRFDRELSNFVLHAEWAFTKAVGEPRYNSGVFVRNGADAVIWHQAQTGSASGGYIFGDTLVGGVKQRINLRDQMKEQRVRPAGEWNTFEIRAEGKTLTLSVNGAPTSEWTGCEVPQGFIGLEAEGFRIEFRSVRMKELP